VPGVGARTEEVGNPDRHGPALPAGEAPAGSSGAYTDERRGSERKTSPRMSSTGSRRLSLAMNSTNPWSASPEKT